MYKQTAARIKLIDRIKTYVDLKRVSCRKSITLCLDVSSTKTGHIMVINDFSSEEHELPTLVSFSPNCLIWNECQTIDVEEYPMENNAVWPSVGERMKAFENQLKSAITRYESIAFDQGIDLDNTYKFLAIESVYIDKFHMSSSLTLSRFQTTAIGIARRFGYDTFEYSNSEVKQLLGAKGQKDFVVPLINDMYNIQIPCTLNSTGRTQKYISSFSHVGDAIGLGYLHSFALREAIKS